MDIRDCIKHMLADSGMSARELSKSLGKYPTYVGTTLQRGSDIGTSNAAMMAKVMGWRLVFKKGDIEMEVTQRADSDKGAAD